MYIYFVKDAFVAQFALSTLGGRYASFRRRAFGKMSSELWFTAFVLYAVYCFLDPGNANVPNMGVWLLGLKAHLYYSIFGMAVATYYCANPTYIYRDFRIMMMIGFVVFALCIIQYSLPPSHILNKYVSDTAAITEFQDFGTVRVTGTFSYITGMTVFGFVTSLMAVALYFGFPQARRGRWIALCYISLGVPVLIMTGSRWGIYALGLFGTMSGFLLTRKRRLSFVGLLVVLTIGLSAVSGYFQDATDAFMNRVNTAGDSLGSRAGATFLGFMNYIFDAGLFGFGVGSLHPAAATLVPGGETFWWLNPLDWNEFEDEFSRILVELGIVGFLLYMTFRISLMVRLLKMALICGETWRPVAVVSASVIASSLTISFVYNVNENLWVWYFVGVSYAVAALSEVQVPALRRGLHHRQQTA